MEPATEAVIAAIETLLRAEWPVSDTEPIAWLDTFGLGPTEVDPAFPCWGNGIPGWDDATTCWSLDGTALAGVGWFLWRDENSQATWRAADALRVGLEDAHGPAEAMPSPSGYRAVWSVGERHIELIAVIRPAEGPSEVQVHVTSCDLTGEECARPGTATA